MTKTKVLFLIGSMNSGGAEKSLLSLLNQLNPDVLELHLLIINKEGILLEQLPAYVHLMEVDNPFLLKLKDSVKILMKQRKYLLLFNRVYFSVLRKLKLFKSYDDASYFRSKKIVLNEDYDVAISYIHGLPLFILVNSIKAKIKIGRIACEFNNNLMDKCIYSNCFKVLDYIFCVSNENRQKLQIEFPDISHKLREFQSLILEDEIRARSIEYKAFDDGFLGTRIVTVARIHYEKGYDLAIESCKKLKDNGYLIRWYIIGSINTEYFQNALDSIESYGLQNTMLLIGETYNPLPYVKECDIYVQPSRMEGKSNAVNEALVLCKPIVITDFPTVKDQIIHNKNGLVVDMSGDGLYNGIAQLIDNKSQSERLTNYNRNFKYGNKEEVLNLLFDTILN